MTDTPRARPLPEFGPEHHLLLNLLAFVALRVMHDPNVAVALDEIEAILPKVSLPSRRAETLADAARALVRARPAGKGDPTRAVAFAFAKLEAGAVLADLFLWRAGLAQEAVRAEGVVDAA
jgi:hypothetical protein